VARGRRGRAPGRPCGRPGGAGAAAGGGHDAEAQTARQPAEAPWAVEVPRLQRRDGCGRRGGDAAEARCAGEEDGRGSGSRAQGSGSRRRTAAARLLGGGPEKGSGSAVVDPLSHAPETATSDPRWRSVDRRRRAWGRADRVGVTLDLRLEMPDRGPAALNLRPGMTNRDPTAAEGGAAEESAGGQTSRGKRAATCLLLLRLDYEREKKWVWCSCCCPSEWSWLLPGQRNGRRQWRCQLRSNLQL